VRAFITGAGGQDGGYLARRLLGEGAEVHALVRSAEARPHLPDVVLHVGDVTDRDRMRSLLLDVAPTEIYNLAAVSSVARSWQQPELTASVNGTAVAALLEAALRLQDAQSMQVRFVQASSAEIFGEPAGSPQDEHTAVRPVSPYGAAKAYAHHLVDVYRRRGLHAVSGILYNHESPRRPPQFVTRKITAAVAAIASGSHDRLRLGDLEVRRDWGWAPDYVEALVRAARADRPMDYVVATGVAHTVGDFVAAAFAHVGIADWSAHVDVDPALRRPIDARELVGDASRARDVLGWTPSVPFEEIVARMVDADLAVLSR
jgi:GDPmannose 4,6-dehydratase